MPKGDRAKVRDLGQLEARLQAAVRVRNERANRNSGNPSKGQVSFNSGRWGSLWRGRVEPLRLCGSFFPDDRRGRPCGGLPPGVGV